jgi:signal transduction histidine kinase
MYNYIVFVLVLTLSIALEAGHRPILTNNYTPIYPTAIHNTDNGISFALDNNHIYIYRNNQMHTVDSGLLTPGTLERLNGVETDEDAGITYFYSYYRIIAFDHFTQDFYKVDFEDDIFPFGATFKHKTALYTHSENILYALDIQSGKTLKTIPLPESVSSELSVVSLFQDRLIYMGKTAFHTYDIKKGRFTELDQFKTQISGISPVGDGLYLLESNTNRVFYYNGKRYDDLKFSNFITVDTSDIPTEANCTLSAGNTHIICNGLAYQLSPSGISLNNDIAVSEIINLSKDKEGSYWISSKQTGLILSSKSIEDIDYSTISSILPGDPQISHLNFIDDKVILTTLSGTIFFLDNEYRVQKEIDINDIVTHSFKASNALYLFGEKNIYVFHDNVLSNQLSYGAKPLANMDGYTSLMVTSASEDSYGNIWFWMAPNGIYKYNPLDHSIHQSSDPFMFNWGEVSPKGRLAFDESQSKLMFSVLSAAYIYDIETLEKVRYMASDVARLKIDGILKNPETINIFNHNGESFLAQSNAVYRYVQETNNWSLLSESPAPRECIVAGDNVVWEVLVNGKVHRWNEQSNQYIDLNHYSFGLNNHKCTVDGDDFILYDSKRIVRFKKGLPLANMHPPHATIVDIKIDNQQLRKGGDLFISANQREFEFSVLNSSTVSPVLNNFTISAKHLSSNDNPGYVINSNKIKMYDFKHGQHIITITPFNNSGLEGKPYVISLYKDVYWYQKEIFKYIVFALVALIVSALIYISYLRVVAKTKVLQNERYLAVFNHEIRTPITAIAGLSEAFKENEQKIPVQLKSNANALYVASEHLLSVIDNALDIEKIKNGGTISVMKEPFNLHEVIKKAILITMLDADQKDIKVVYECDDIKVNSDRAKILQVMLNFIRNAIAYNNVGGHVYVSGGFTESKEFYIRIEDNGIGMSPEDQKRVTKQMWTRIGSSSSAKGFGIGLHASCAILNSLNCDFTLDSEEGVGTRLQIIFPNDAADFSSLSDKVKKFNGLNWKKANIVFIEDQPQLCELLSSWIRVNPDSYVFNPSYLTLEKVKENIELIEKIKRADIIISDYDIRAKDFKAEDLINYLKPYNRKANVILATGHTEQDIAKENTQWVDLYLSKPYTKNKIENAVTSILGDEYIAGQELDDSDLFISSPVFSLFAYKTAALLATAITILQSKKPDYNELKDCLHTLKSSNFNVMSEIGKKQITAIHIQLSEHGLSEEFKCESLPTLIGLHKELVETL